MASMMLQSDLYDVEQGDDEDPVTFFDQPPVDFDPLTADADQLEHYGIPPKPDRLRQPLLYEFWLDMYRLPLAFVEPGVDATLTSERNSSKLRVTATARREGSFNWSGAYVTPRNGRQFTEVHAAWTVPPVALPTGRIHDPKAEYRSSIWIGLDGEQRYFDSSLPQLGTGQVVNAPAVPPYHVWCQWWVRNNQKSFSPRVLKLQVAPGDSVKASLRRLGPTRVHGVIKNRTTNGIIRFKMQVQKDLLGRRPKIAGATAEWIVERPAKGLEGALYELPNYHQVYFRKCLAVSAELRADGTLGPGQEQTLVGARLISMHKVERNPLRSVTISAPRSPHGPRVDQFTTSYVP